MFMLMPEEFLESCSLEELLDIQSKVKIHIDKYEEKKVIKKIDEINQLINLVFAETSKLIAMTEHLGYIIEDEVLGLGTNEISMLKKGNYDSDTGAPALANTIYLCN